MLFTPKTTKIPAVTPNYLLVGAIAHATNKDNSPGFLAISSGWKPESKMTEGQKRDFPASERRKLGFAGSYGCNDEKS